MATVWVLDQDSAKEFYTEKLGLELRNDMTLGEGGMRWLTVGAKDQPELDLILMSPGPPDARPETAEQVRALVAKGVLGAGAFTTDDCAADHQALVREGRRVRPGAAGARTASRPSSATTRATGTASPSRSRSSTRAPTGAASP